MLKIIFGELPLAVEIPVHLPNPHHNQEVDGGYTSNPDSEEGYSYVFYRWQVNNIKW